MNAERDASELSRLRWRCRRGMRELDQLMLRYLDRFWLQASADERATFDAVLGMEDDQLWRWFMGREPVPDNAAGALIERIRQLPP